VSSAPEPVEQPQPILRGVWQRLSLSELAALLVGFLYVSGYFINSIFVRNLGISDTELLRLEYIKTGFTFVLTLGFVYLPIGAFALTYNVRRSSGLPHLHAGAVGNSLNTTFFLAFPLFLAFFITRYEWEMSLPAPVFGLAKFKSAALAAVALSTIGTVIVPSFERVVDKRMPEHWRMPLFRFLIEPIRYGLLLASLYLILRSLAQIQWMGALVANGLYYFLVVVVFVTGLSAATLWVRLIRKIKGSWLVYSLIGFGVAVLYYLAITSYVFGVYIFIPANRGGRLPLTRAYLEVTGHDTLFAEERVVGGVKVRGPVYIIEDHSDSLFVAAEKMDRWLYEFVPIHSIRKESIPYVYVERIEDGFPRVTNSAAGGSKQMTFFPEEFYQARRVFQYDYIYVDAFFLLIWLALLIRNKEYKALVFGAVISPIIYLIDAYIWWNSSAGPTHPAGTHIREYWIGGAQVPRPQGAYLWPKFGADFMMTISYALYTFPWLYIVFRNLRKGTLFSKEVLRYTVIWVAAWFLTPLLSILLSINDTPVQAVRYMNSQFTGWIINLIIGYGLLAVVYRKNLAWVAYLLGIGVLGAFIMEIPLYAFGIRPTGILFIIFEGFFLLNQGVPYLFLTVDKIIPAAQRKFRPPVTSNP
jgi:hypothetical protein